LPLDRATLETSLAAALRDNFQRGKDEAWESDRAADEMARAIADAVDVYVSGARVAGVQSEVRNAGNVVIGTGTQTGQVPLS
jgi:hypothetical protein